MSPFVRLCGRLTVIGAVAVAAVVAGGLLRDARGDTSQTSIDPAGAALAGSSTSPTPGAIFSPMPSGTTSGLPDQVAVAAWASGHVDTSAILARVNLSGLPASLATPAPARLLLFGASDLDLVNVSDPAIRGFAIYRYPDAAAAHRAWSLDAVQDPQRGMVDYVARPYFVLVGDALVGFATNDAQAARRLIDALR